MKKSKKILLKQHLPMKFFGENLSKTLSLSITVFLTLIGGVQFVEATCVPQVPNVVCEGTAVSLEGSGATNWASWGNLKISTTSAVPLRCIVEGRVPNATKNWTLQSPICLSPAVTLVSGTPITIGDPSSTDSNGILCGSAAGHNGWPSFPAWNTPLALNCIASTTGASVSMYLYVKGACANKSDQGSSVVGKSWACKSTVPVQSDDPTNCT